MTQIKHKDTGQILFELKDKNLEETLLGAINAKVVLQGADLREVKLKNMDFQGIDLRLSNLGGAHLEGIDFRGAYLGGTNFGGASLKNANLEAAHLRGASMESTSLEGANLKNTDLERTKLIRTNLKNADFKYAELNSTIFGLTDLSECLNLDKAIVRSICVIDFETLRKSAHLPQSFLRKIGLPELYINYLPDFYQEEALNLYPVFLSHNSKDKTFARKLYECLINKGVLVWFDEKKMRAGDDIYETISTNIKSYDKMILICSKNSLEKSWWVNKEIKEARKKEEEYFKKTGKEINIIVPITIDDYIHEEWESPNKSYITNIYIEDFSNWEDEKEFEIKLDKLVEALNANRKGDNLYSLLEK